jgi:chondroitin AC lyase
MGIPASQMDACIAWCRIESTRPRRRRPPRKGLMPAPLPAPCCRILLAAALTASVAAAAAPPPPAWLPTVQARVLQSLLPQTSAECAAAVRIATTMRRSLDPTNGTWADLDYAERKSAGWPLLKHLNRVTSMATAWASPLLSETHHDPELLNATLLALRYWLRTDPQDPNWYQMDIAAPREVGKQGVLLRDALLLSNADRAAMDAMLQRAKRGAASGANGLDMHRIQAMRAVMLGNGTMLAEALGAAFAGIEYCPQGSDGFMVDHSFHQHGGW